MDSIVKLNINVKIKHKTRVILNMCHEAFVNGCVTNLANLAQTRTLCKYISTDPMFSAILTGLFQSTKPNFRKGNVP